MADQGAIGVAQTGTCANACLPSGYWSGSGGMSHSGLSCSGAWPEGWWNRYAAVIGCFDPAMPSGASAALAGRVTNRYGSPLSRQVAACALGRNLLVWQGQSGADGRYNLAMANPPVYRALDRGYSVGDPLYVIAFPQPGDDANAAILTGLTGV
ncbi:MAG: hypothetical protein HQL51_15815 [Magnetococcales bacterium]|nr:hypothetical protein [Magnetococcales bacterium]